MRLQWGMLACALLLIAPTRARAAILTDGPPPPPFYSIEEAASRSEHIFTATVVTATYSYVSLRVNEVLRGNPGEHVRFDSPLATWAGWMSVARPGDQMLIFAGPNGPLLPILLNRNTEALTMHLERLTTREQVMSAARRLAREMPSSPWF